MKKILFLLGILAVAMMGYSQPKPGNGGTFMMGSPKSEAGRASDETQHQVTVKGFWMSPYLVTQKDYFALMGTNPSSNKTDGKEPVTDVNWYDAVKYANKLSEKEGLKPVYVINGTDVSWPDKTANGYRLPTEAEWEFAARAGTTTAYYTGDSINDTQANFNNNVGQTTPVGSYPPNTWGLYDMAGNVYEWCWDWYRADYETLTSDNPSGADTGCYRVLRGGYWDFSARLLRSASRNNAYPSNANYNLGFRLVHYL